MSSIPELALTPDHDLGAVHTLPEFRAIIEAHPMTLADRETLAEQAAAMIDGVYVHLLQKRAMYGIDPGQRLRLLQRRLAQMTDAQFHAELLAIFTELRDLHTNYILPSPYQGPFAFLGIMLEQHWDNGEPRWMVSKVWNGLTGDPHLVPGAEVSHWNGSPIALAVARHAELEAGSNPAARLARGREHDAATPPCRRRQTRTGSICATAPMARSSRRASRGACSTASMTSPRRWAAARVPRWQAPRRRRRT